MAGVFLKTEVAAVCVQLAFPRKYVVLFREVLFANKFLLGYNINIIICETVRQAMVCWQSMKALVCGSRRKQSGRS